MRNFLLYLAGARRDILEQVPSERSRFLALGLSLLLDGVFIGVVATLGFVQTSVNAALASVYGCVIGLLFLGLDSRLVAPTARSRRIFAAIPRVLLALLCGAIFSTTIAIGALRPEINQQIAVMKQHAQAEFLQQQSASALNFEIEKLQDESNNLHSIIATGGGTTLNPSNDPELRSLKDQLTAVQASETSAFEDLQCQLYGTSANGDKCTPGSGVLAQNAQQRYEIYRDQAHQLNAEIGSREQQLTSSDASAQHARLAEAEGQLPGVDLELTKDQQTLVAEDSGFTAANNSNDGLLRKAQALSELTGSNSSIRYYILILFFLISILQCVPVFLVIVQRSGYYEMVLQAAQRQEALKAQYRMRAAVEDVLLEQVLERESLSAKPTLTTRPAPPPPSVTWPSAATDDTVDESEDAALRGMQDMRAVAYPDAGQTAD